MMLKKEVEHSEYVFSKHTNFWNNTSCGAQHIETKVPYGSL